MHSIGDIEIKLMNKNSRGFRQYEPLLITKSIIKDLRNYFVIGSLQLLTIQHKSIRKQYCVLFSSYTNHASASSESIKKFTWINCIYILTLYQHLNFRQELSKWKNFQYTFLHLLKCTHKPHIIHELNELRIWNQ